MSDTNLSNNRYFQYKAFLWTDYNTKTPKLYNISVNYLNETTVTSAITPSPAYSSAQLTCSATGYKPDGGDFNLTFRWFNGTSFYNETNISSSNNVQKTWSLPAGIQIYGETWNCTVRVYVNSTDYSSWQSSTITIGDSTYAGADDVYYDFLYNYNATNYNNSTIRLQARSCQQSDCSGTSFAGPDNTSGSWFNNSVYNNLSILPDNRYFQYKALLATTDNTTTPKLFNISLSYSGNRTINQLTVEGWAKGKTSGKRTILERVNSYRIYINESRFAGGFYNGSSWSEIQGSSALSDDEWYHLALSYSNESSLKLYINGIESASAGSSGSIYLNTNEIYIGSSDIGNLFNGTIDEVRIYNRSLSAQEILMHYQSEFSKYNATEWRFYDNITNLTDGSYNYYGWANDSAGNQNSTEIRRLTIDTIIPSISFTSPTPANNSYIPRNFTEVNISITEPNLDGFLFSWNNTNYSFYDSSLVLAMNFNNNSGIGECYDNETEILTEEGWKFFKDLNRNERVATLNTEDLNTENPRQKTQDPRLEYRKPKTENPRLEWQEPTDYQTYQHDSEMFQIELEDGSNLVVSPEHKVYGLLYSSAILSQPSPTINNLPLKSLTPSKSKAVASTSFSGQGGWIRKTTIPENSLGGNKSALRKSVSLLSSTSFPSFANNATLPLTTPFGTYFTENPPDSKNSLTSTGIFSSSRNWEFDIALSSGKLGSIPQCFVNHLPTQTWIAPQNLSGWFTSSNKFKDITDQNSSSLESGLSMTDFCINNNAFANFNSHNLNIEQNYLNTFSLQKVTEVYEKLEEDSNLEYYFLDSENNPVKVLKIEKVPYSGKIYDVDVPNDIVLVRRNGIPVWSGNSNTKAVDISKYGNNGTIYGAVWNSSGRFGSALQFDGVNDYVDAGNGTSLFPTSAITLESWLYHTGGSFNQFAIGGGLVADFRYGLVWQQNTGKIVFSFHNGTAWDDRAFSRVIPENTWIHIVGTYNGSRAKIYYNGILDDDRAVTGSLTYPANPHTYFGYPLATNHWWNGRADEVRIYNRSLSATEIQMHYQSEFSKYNSTEWRFYDNITNISDGAYQYYGWANDSAGNQNSSEIRALTIDTIKPGISFVEPTDANNSYISRNWTYINTSISDTNNITALIDFNRSLVGWWRFNQESGESSTLVRDWSTWGNSGTCSGANCPTATTAGKFGSALQFDGLDDYVNVADHNSLDTINAFTVSAWVKKKDTGALQGIVGHWGSGNIGWTFFSDSVNKLGLYLGNGILNSSGGYGTIDTNWHHVAVVWNSNEAKARFYIDGSFDVERGTISPITAPIYDLVIGSLYYPSISPFNGTIDEVRIYNRALGPEEINASYNAGIHCYDNNTQIMTREELTKEDTYSPSNFVNSSLLNALTLDCFLNLDSSDQIGQFNFNANAKYSTSFRCGADSFASDILSEKSSNGINLTFNLIIPTNASKSLSENPDLSLISSLFRSSSTNSLNGANNSTLSENRTSNVQLCSRLPLVIIPANNSLASTTNFIYTRPFSLSSVSMPSLTLEPSSNAFFSVNLLLAANASNTNLCNSLLLFNSNSNTLSLINSFNISSILGNSLTSLSSSFGISTINSGINNNTPENYLNALPLCSETSEGYCQENGRFYSQGWKFFKDVDFADKVATLNPETKQTEYRNPSEMQDYDYSGEMYRIKTQNGDLVVSPEHKVYGAVVDNMISFGNHSSDFSSEKSDKYKSNGLSFKVSDTGSTSRPKDSNVITPIKPYQLPLKSKLEKLPPYLSA